MQASACASHHAPYFLFTVFDGSCAPTSSTCSPPSIMVQHNDHDDSVAFAAPAAVSPSELWLEPVELHWKFWTAFYFEKTACASSPRRSFKRAGATGWSPAGSHGCHGCHGCQFVFVTWV